MNLCFGTAQVACARGELRAGLQIGSQRAIAIKSSIKQRGIQRLQFAVPERVWRRGLDPQRKPALPFRTALLVLRVEGSCTDPQEFGAGVDTYHEVVDVRAFVAGFASGE